MSYEQALQNHYDSLEFADQQMVTTTHPHIFEYQLHNGKVLVYSMHRGDEIEIMRVEYKTVNILPIIDEEEIYYIKLKSKETF